MKIAILINGALAVASFIAAHFVFANARTAEENWNGVFWGLVGAAFTAIEVVLLITWFILS